MIHNAKQSTGTLVFRINATHYNEAISSAKNISENYLFTENLIYEYHIDVPSTYPQLPQPYQPKEENNNPTSNVMYGYDIEVTRIVWSLINANATQFKTDHIITNCTQHNKPHLYAHIEAHSPPIIKTPLQFYLQKNGETEFRTDKLIGLIKKQYNCYDITGKKIRPFIDNSIKTDYLININNIYEGLIVKYPIWENEPTSFILLLISEPNSSNIIINKNIVEIIQNNPYLNDIIIQYQYDLLNKNIQSKINNKKSLKI